jgi:hypothetical protein
MTYRSSKQIDTNPLLRAPWYPRVRCAIGPTTTTTSVYGTVDSSTTRINVTNVSDFSTDTVDNDLSATSSVTNHTGPALLPPATSSPSVLEENRRRQGRLLLVSLLEHFCQLYDQSPDQSRQLFFMICRALSNMGIIDEEYIDEMAPVRASYKRAFSELFAQAVAAIRESGGSRRFALDAAADDAARDFAQIDSSSTCYAR